MTSSDLTTQPTESTRPICSTSFRAIGTTVTILTTDRGRLGAAEAVTRSHIEALDCTASRFRDDSEITRLRSSHGRPVEVSPLLLELVGEALWAAKVTGGLLDPTVGHALELCGYDRDFDMIATSGPAIELMCRRVPGWQGITVDADTRTISVPRDVVIDLGATAKASCADHATRDASIASGVGVLVNIGGDLAAAGPAPQGGWPIKIAERHDDPAGGPGPRVSIDRGGHATSGTAARRWQRGGEVLHHVIDPETGLPASTCWRTVSITADTCLAANVAATAAIIVGDQAPQWLTDRGFHTRLQAEDGQVVRVGGWPADDDADSTAPPRRRSKPMFETAA